ncbi:MAG: phenylacetate--CoA ligase family protein [Candidatus Bathyarchaeales archaeon]
MSSAYSLFAENLLLPFYDFVRGTCRFKCSRVLDKTQWLSKKEIQRIQVDNLRALLTHAYETVPYYRRIFKERKLIPSDIRCTDDLVKLPVLSKADIRRHYWDLVSRGFPRNKLVSSVSGGTGDQIKFFVTKEQQSWEVAAEFRAYGWAGYRFGDRCVVFWGSPVDLSKYSGLIKRFTSYLERVFVLNTYVLSDDVLERYVRIMRKVRPLAVRGYASSVYMVAKYMLKIGCDDIRPRVVLTSAESLMDFQRKTIEDAFGCKVFDYYGSREVGAIAAECEEHSGYHISAENTLLEFVRDGEHVSAGESGEILVTSLRNFGMPFIRYAIGDVGKPSDELCRCGRGLPLMSSIEGRVSQFMAVYDKQLGRVVPVSTAAPGPFSWVLMQVPIESYRVIQESLDRIVIVAVKGEAYRQEHSDFVINYMRKLLGYNVTIEFKFVDYLPPLPSGKRSLFISKINPFKLHNI